MFDSNETLEAARARNVHDALMEDIGRGDWTAQLVPAGRRVNARVLVREDAVLCGRDWFDACLAEQAKAQAEMQAQQAQQMEQMQQQMQQIQQMQPYWLQPLLC